MVKKSRFQQRLEEIQKKMKTESEGDSGPGEVKLHNKQYPWIDIEDELPPYYSPIDIIDSEENYHENWHRLNNGSQDFYANLKDDRVRIHITEWRKRPGIKYTKYEPMTILDVITIQLQHELIPEDGRPLDGDEMGFNTGIRKAIDIIKKHTTAP